MVFILCILSFNWAELFKVQQNMTAPTVAVVSFDSQFAPYDGVTPLLGPAVTKAAEMQRQQKKDGVLGYVLRILDYYNNDRLR